MTLNKFALYCCVCNYVSICLLILKYSDPPQQGAQPGPAVLCAVKYHSEQALEQYFTPLEPMDLSREMLRSLPHNFMYKTSISINILFSGFSTHLSIIKITLPLQHKHRILIIIPRKLELFPFKGTVAE